MIFFGLVCIQISYPVIYNLLFKEPNFLQWDSSFARNQGIKIEDIDKENDEIEIYGIEEEWEKVIYKLSQTNEYLMKNLFNIINLLTLIKNLSTDENSLEECISSLISMTSITSIERASSNENLDRNIHNDARRKIIHETPEDFYKMLSEWGIPEKITNNSKIIRDLILNLLGDNIRIIYSYQISIETNHRSGRARLVAKLWHSKRTLFIWSGKLYKIKRRDNIDNEEFVQEFSKNIVDVYNNISKQEHRIASYVSPNVAADAAWPAADAQTAAPASPETSGSC